MTAITDKANIEFRDMESPGSSVPHEPGKPGIRELFAVIDIALGSLGVNGAITVKHATRSGLLGDLAHAAGTLAVVYDDPAPAYNGIYAKEGGSGTGTWTITSLALPSSFADDLAEVLAQIGEVGAAAAAAAASAVTAAAASTAAQTARDESQEARDESEAARDIAVAAAEASGNVEFFSTKAAANAALGGLSNGQVVEVAADESQAGRRTRYVVTAGAYVFVIALPSYGDPMVANTAYVSVNGDDGTGVVGLPGRPFREVDGALTAVASVVGLATIIILDGTSADYQPATTDNDAGSLIRSDLKIIWPGDAAPNATCESLTGTAIPGPFIIDTAIRSNVQLINPSIDSGKTITDALYSGVGVEGLLFANVDQTVGADEMTGVYSERGVVLMRDDNSGGHAFLVENTVGARIVDPTTIYGLHPLTIKSRETNITGARGYRNNSEGFIVKGEDYANAGDVMIGDLTIGATPPGTTPYFTAAMQSGVMVNPATANVINVHFGKVSVSSVVFGLNFLLPSGSYYAQNVTFETLSFESCLYYCILIQGAGSLVDWRAKSVYAADCAGTVIAYDPASTILRAHIGEIVTLNCGPTIDLTGSSQDLMVDVLQVRSQISGTYVYKLGSGRLRIGKEVIQEASQAQRWHPDNRPVHSSGWSTTGGLPTTANPDVRLGNYGVVLNRRAYQATDSATNRIFTGPLALLPDTTDFSRRLPPVRGKLHGGGECLVEMIVGQDGSDLVLDVERIDGVAATPGALEWVELTGVGWTY